MMQDSFSRRETLPDPALALIRTPLGKGEERQMQLITVNRVAASMKSLMPSREKEIGNAEQNAYHGNGVVWPKAEFLAKRNLANSGTDVDALQAENEALKARLAALESGDTSDGVDEDEDTKEDGDDYDKMDGKALKALAAERGVDIKGMTKV
ncbi:MAG TPA: hypothetical protein PKJ97_02335, partial [Candidatus Bilamarchaeaceae archaeon]|nr:hypothetical protein [Candidatus Bilamarchaeaceae archaeon]